MADTLFDLRGDHITLDALLKATGLAHSGGAAKVLIAEGVVAVNGTTETRRGRKLRARDVVQLGDSTVRVQAGAQGGDQNNASTDAFTDAFTEVSTDAVTEVQGRSGGP